MTYVRAASATLASTLCEPYAERVRRLMQTGERLISSPNRSFITADRPGLQLAQPLGIAIECIRPAP